MTKRRLTLFIDEEDVMDLKLSAVQKDKTLSQYLVDEGIKFTYNLTDNIVCVVGYIGEVKQGTDFWRVDVEFIDKSTGYYLRNGWYEIWASYEFIEDYLRLPSNKPLNKQTIANFAFAFVTDRYNKNSNELPKEYGAFCSNKTGVRHVDHSGTLVSYFEEL